ncbi:hypothetical protein OIE13_06140 [Streptosporangium sp. NBC_01810]|uniref:hypothetical protein n=1 Tax=Streptosporangium sp. NBC_01810 TaxID=2975951 RepID=UPI002DDC8227|nr:hypothetical protein [Streptosporangium sp. NBC_01810]WSA27454.1 hypothetical protein OIE13_06140 [Streptosporangium sp. NBC_01810]
MDLKTFAQTLTRKINELEGVETAELLDGQDPPLIGVSTTDGTDAFFVEIQPS